MPFPSFARSQRGKDEIWIFVDDRQTLAAIDGASGGGVVRGIRPHLERVIALREPALGDLPNLLRRRLLDHAQRSSVTGRIGFVYLAGCENIGFAAETADSLEALDETGAHRHPGAIELGFRRALQHEAAQFFLDRRLDFPLVDAGLHIRRDSEETRDLERLWPADALSAI